MDYFLKESGNQLSILSKDLPEISDEVLGDFTRNQNTDRPARTCLDGGQHIDYAENIVHVVVTSSSGFASSLVYFESALDPT